MKRNLVTIVVAVLFVTAVVYLASHAARRGHPAASLSPGVEALVNKQAPDFELTSLDGSKVRLSDYKGKAVVLNFWATWCGPCKVEMPWLVQLENQYHAQGLEIVGVSMDDESRDKVKAFAQQMQLNYPVLMGRDSSTSEEMLEQRYGGLEGLPTTFYIDRNGKIVESVEGLISKGEIEDNIKKALKNS